MEHRISLEPAAIACLIFQLILCIIQLEKLKGRINHHDKSSLKHP